MAYVTAGPTMILLLLRDIFHSSLSMHAPSKVARIMVSVTNLLSAIMYHVGTLLTMFPSRILRLLKLPTDNYSSVNYEVLLLIVAGAVHSDSIGNQKSKSIHNLLDLEETNVSEVIFPYKYMVLIAVCKSLQQFLHK